MVSKIEEFNKEQLKKKLPEIKPGDTVRLSLAIKEKNKEKIQIFEGVVIAIKHGQGISGTITVRKIISGIGVEKIFPIHSPIIKKIEVTKRSKVRRAKLYYLRNIKGKKAKLKNKGLNEAIIWEEEKSEDKKELETHEEKEQPIEEKSDGHHEKESAKEKAGAQPSE